MRIWASHVPHGEGPRNERLLTGNAFQHSGQHCLYHARPLKFTKIWRLNIFSVSPVRCSWAEFLSKEIKACKTQKSASGVKTTSLHIIARNVNLRRILLRVAELTTSYSTYKNPVLSEGDHWDRNVHWSSMFAITESKFYVHFYRL